ncbi:hypothetical protein [uncultured Rhodoblastus sp.]|uniref:hypothetical protein n=1 Tax=uncultured Rhodoblastus sp. TaxID=543037 RepID=UPI0025D0CDBA|nr:hypothetical protein [uncultured Rhodoblastus sp.]
MKLDDEEEAVVTKIWRVQFDDPQSQTDFLALCPDAFYLEGWFLVMNCVIREFVIEHGCARLEEIVAIEFNSLRLRKRFIDETDH